jgi:FKBP-type peptidyl-prolyl cis-trans isomerase FklB
MPSIFTRFSSALLVLVLAGSFAQSQTGASSPANAPKKKSTTAPAKKAPAAAVKQPAELTITTPEQKLSYALGSDMGKRLKASGVQIDSAILARGIHDSMTGNKQLMTEDDIRSTIASAQKDLQQKQMAKVKELGDKNKKEGDAFLAENKTKEGVVTLPSGLQYKILKEGTGPKPTANDTVVCNYRGTLLNGKEFDSSYSRKEPASFPVNRVIKGWTEALQLMPVGSKWQLFIPPDLAYGERGAGADIEPDSTLVFEVELISIQPPGAKPADGK